MLCRFHGINAMILMPQIFYVIANENAPNKRNELKEYSRCFTVLYLQWYYISFIEPCENFSIQFPMNTVIKYFASWPNHTRRYLHQIRLSVFLNKRNLNLLKMELLPWERLRSSRDLFVPRSYSFPMNPEKKDTHSLNKPESLNLHFRKVNTYLTSPRQHLQYLLPHFNRDDTCQEETEMNAGGRLKISQRRHMPRRDRNEGRW